MNTLSIQVTDSQVSFLEAQAAQEGLATPVDFVQELIRAAEKRAAWAALERAIEKGLDSGEPIPTTDSYWEDKKQLLLKKHAEVSRPCNDDSSSCRKQIGI